MATNLPDRQYQGALEAWGSSGRAVGTVPAGIVLPHGEGMEGKALPALRTPGKHLGTNLEGLIPTGPGCSKPQGTAREQFLIPKNPARTKGTEPPMGRMEM